MASTPEMRFLARCLPHTHADSSDQAGDLAALNWSVLLDTARWQGMMPLLAHNLSLSDSPTVAHLRIPAAVLQTLRSYQRWHLFRSITQSAALVALQREFNHAGLAVLSWKGPSVGILLYGSATLRDSIDLDFLFLEKDIQKLLTITRALGYRLSGSTDSEEKDLYLLALHGEFTFYRETDKLFLEFHLHTLPPRFHLWQDSFHDIDRASILCPLGDVGLLMQVPEDLLVSLCAHATKHNWDRMKWSCDIAQFVRIYGDQLDWSALLTHLRRSKKDSVVLLGLALAADLFTIELPQVVTASLARRQDVVSLAQDLAANVMGGTPGIVPVSQQKAVFALLCPRLRDRIVYKLRPLVELNYEDLHIPFHSRMFFFLNYLFRGLRLLRKYGPHLFAAKTADSVRSAR